MSVVETIEKLREVAQASDADRKSRDAAKQLRDVEEVERTLKKIGISLEPVFNISLKSRMW